MFDISTFVFCAAKQPYTIKHKPPVFPISYYM